ncbi:nose resistant to fluoxetine protein 6 isoform X3 [Leptinotarsa decemlineata]
MMKLIFFLLHSIYIFSVDAVFGDSDVLEYSIFPSLPVAVSKSVNIRCKEESDMYRDSLKNFTLWAHEMWDSTAKSSTGVLRGNVFQMGHFEQCLSARAPFSPKYCLATITAGIPKPKKKRDHLSLYFDPNESVFQRLHVYSDVSQQPRNSVKVGWCIPSSCTIHDLKNNLNDYLANVVNRFKTHNITYTVNFLDMFCHTAGENHYFDKADISFCFLTIILVLLVLLATIYDYVKSSENTEEKPFERSLSSKLIMAFSARENFNEMNVADNSNPALSILYGVRTLCILLIIVFHRFGTFISSAIMNFNHLESQYRSSIACLLFHGDLFVDTFFILSGLLVVYGLMNQFEKRIMNPAMIVLLRYIRLTPVYAFVIFYYATVFNHTGNGPLWKVIAGEDSKDCRRNWWTNLLYISNYVNPDHMCMTHSWYLPCDFHYFIIAIFLCILIKKEKKMGLGILILFMVISMAIPFAITIIYQRPGLMYFYPEFLTGPKVYIDFLLTYSKSHTRATPYFVGMIAGYVYYKLKNTNEHICRMKTFVIVLGSGCIMMVSVFSAKIFYNPYHPYNAIESATYAAFHRLGWAVGTSGLFYVASYGHASYLKKILSWSPWIPLSKLVYGAYLTHMSFQLRSAAKFMNPRQLTYFDVL